MAKLSVQILPKKQGLLECLVAKPGHKIVYTDFSALEMRVAAAATRDKNLMKLYGPTANPAHDVYLFNAAHVPIWQDEVLPYYDLDNPDPARIKQAKKDLVHIRDLAKPITLSWQYGARARRFCEELNLAGHNITLEECQIVEQSLDKTYTGLKPFERELRREWRRNKGWFLNGFGRPMTIRSPYRNKDDKHIDTLKDILNRYIQSTGHDILVYFLCLLDSKLQGLKAEPWIADEHDATFFEVADEHVEKAVEKFQLTFDALNAKLNLPVKFTGDIKIANNLAELKID